MMTNRLLAAIVLLQGLILASVWSGRWTYESVAQAQVPDPGAQRIRMIEELRTLNQKMDRLTGFLESGKLQVRVATPDEKDGTAR